MKSIPMLLPGLSFLLLWASASLLHSGQAAAAARMEHHLMPVPARVKFSEGALMIDPALKSS
ncbi:MAG: hypothetical protein ACE5JX_21135 [Acidobacteriota bacterium]